MSRGSTPLADNWVAPADRLDTLPPWPWEPRDPAAPRTLGWHAWAWATGFLGEFHRDQFPGLIQPNGPRAGQRFEFTPRQLRFLLWWYCVDDEGRWVFNHGARRLAKGSGKSPFAAVFSLAEFCAPVRFERFDDRMPGGVRGRPVDMPLVQIAATAESQTANTMRMVRAFAPKGSPIVEHYQLDPGKTRYYKQPEGTLEVITSSVTASEGAEASAIVADETEHWKPSNAGPELASTLIDNLAKSGSRMWETSNAWVPGQDSVAEDTFETWCAQELGGTRSEVKILYDAVIAPGDVDLTDADSLREVLRVVYADCWWQDIEPILARIHSGRGSAAAAESEIRRKYLNRPSVLDAAWCDPARWSVIAKPRTVDEAEPVTLFFDGSMTRDATAFAAAVIGDGYTFIPTVAGGRPAVWEPDPSHVAKEPIDVEAVDEALEWIMSHYNVVAFFADVNQWESFTKVEWPRRYADRLQLRAQDGGKDPQAIAWDMRGHVMEFTRAAELVADEIVRGEFHHDANPVLARHVANCQNEENRWGVSVQKRESSKKIDAAVAMIGARMVRQQFLAAKPKKRPGNFVGLKR